MYVTLMACATVVGDNTQQTARAAGNTGKGWGKHGENPKTLRLAYYNLIRYYMLRPALGKYTHHLKTPTVFLSCFPRFKTMRLISAIFVLLILSFGCKKSKEENIVNPSNRDTTIINPPNRPDTAVAASKTPKLFTNDISNLTHYSVILSGKLLDTVGGQVSELGIVVDTTPLPTIDRRLNKFIVKADANGEFLKHVIDVPQNTVFYVRSYGINSYGVGYGNEVKFTSLKDKTVDGDIVLTTQEEVEKFGANNYTSIVSLEITGSVTDLSPLKSLSKMTNGFIIRGTTKLKNLSGLENIEVIGNIFPSVSRIENNTALTSLTGLKNLKWINGDFYIKNNDQLTDLKGLDSYSTITMGEFRIAECDNLKSLDGLEQFVYAERQLTLINNPLLEDIKALGNKLKTVSEINIVNNPSIKNLDAFINIQKLLALWLKDNNSLVDINGLSNLQEVRGINIDGNLMLSDIPTFKKITHLEELTIKNNNSLKDLTGFSNLEAVSGMLTIENNNSLIDLTGLEKLTTLKRLGIGNNGSLINLKGLSGLTTIAGSSYSIGISRNDKLQSLLGLENLSYVSGQVYIGFNKSLNGFCPLKKLFLQTSTFEYVKEGNALNPTKEEIIANCN
jgi:hypothetical protein